MGALDVRDDGRISNVDNLSWLDHALVKGYSGSASSHGFGHVLKFRRRSSARPFTILVQRIKGTHGPD
jgi:hypothetical protein